jgi:hypothetical protein
MGVIGWRFQYPIAWTVSFLRYMLLLSARERVYLHGLTAELEAGRCRTDYIATPVNTKLQTLFLNSKHIRR